MSISSIPSWGVAIAQWLLIPAATGLTAGFAAASSKARPAVAVAVIALGYSFQFGFSSSIPDLRISGPLAGVCWANIFNALDILLWSRISYRSQVEWERSRNSAHERQLSSFSKQLKWSLALPFNYRRIDTPWEIRNLPKFDKRDSQSVPSRSAFLLQAAMKLFISVFLLIVSIVEPDVPGVGALVSEMCGRSPSLIPRSADISLRNLLAQASFVLSFAMMTRFSINAIYYTFAVICVSSCFSEPASWPPISELITEAWSIQRFWRYVNVFNEDLTDKLVMHGINVTE